MILPAEPHPKPPVVRLRNKIGVRLIPSILLEPRARVVDTDRVVEGDAFDLNSLLIEAGVQHEARLANSTVQQRVLFSIEASSMRDNRFNRAGGDGALYAADSLPAAIEEIRWHLAHPDSENVPFDKTRVYRAVSMHLSGDFLDMEQVRPGHRALHPDPAIGYPAGARLADRARAAGLAGIAYPSVRNENGQCMAVFYRESIDEIRLGKLVSFEPPAISDAMWRYRVHEPAHLAQAMSLSQA